MYNYNSWHSVADTNVPTKEPNILNSVFPIGSEDEYITEKEFMDAAHQKMEEHVAEIISKEPHIKDSGARTEYETGAVRDVKEGKGRCDLLPLNEIACVMNNEDRLEEAEFFQFMQKFKSTGCVTFLYDAITRQCPFENVDVLVLEVSKHFEEGANKYGIGNWEKGIPVHSYIDSAIRHYLKFNAGWKDEPHDRAFVWNLLCCAWTMNHKPEMDDFTEGKKND